MSHAHWCVKGKLELLRIGLQILFESLFSWRHFWELRDTLFKWVWDFYMLLHIVVDVLTAPNSGRGFCRDDYQSFSLFQVIVLWIMLNLWLIYSISAWWVESGFPPVWWVELWAGLFLMGPIFQSWRAKHQRLQMIITTPDVFTAFQRGDWVYYLQLCCSCLMSPLFVRSQNFHCSFLVSLFMKKCHIIHIACGSFHVEIKPLKCQNCGR